jgi:hypothetical protein
MVEKNILIKSSNQNVTHFCTILRIRKLPDAINISYRNDSLPFASTKTLNQMVMATQKKDTIIRLPAI